MRASSFSMGMCCSRKYPPYGRLLEIPGRGWGSQKPKFLKESMNLDWTFQSELGDSTQKPFHGRGMDFFWNNTVHGNVVKII